MGAWGVSAGAPRTPSPRPGAACVPQTRPLVSRGCHQTEGPKSLWGARGPSCFFWTSRAASCQPSTVSPDTASGLVGTKAKSVGASWLCTPVPAHPNRPLPCWMLFLQHQSSQPPGAPGRRRIRVVL